MVTLCTTERNIAWSFAATFMIIGAMPLQLLLLLTLLGSSSSLQLPAIWKDGAREAPGLLLARGRREATTTWEMGFNNQDDYVYIGTDPPEMLDYSPKTVTMSTKSLILMETLGQRGPVGTGTPEPATVEPVTRDFAVLGAGEAARGDMSIQLATAMPSIPKTPAMKLTTTEDLAMGPTATEALAMLAMGPTATEDLAMLSMGPKATEALTTEPAATKALSKEPTATAALSTEPATTGALSTGPTTTEALSILSMGPTATEALTTEPVATEAKTTESATTRGPTTSFLLSSDPQSNTTVAVNKPLDVNIKQGEVARELYPRSSVAPTSTGIPDHIPVKQCLLAILILALVATIFLVCTVVLAVRLSRKNHRYPVRSYSPTEMVCISSLLPDGGGAEGPTAAATNGGLPNAKSQAQKPERREARDGDDLTLRSFLP
ncbi:P-selectin glycoprotein ligand 1 isoform X2 [Elephas maximus indicus]|uniref:P-selectin glycoprotein ligand 1 isoform X2 n=1 Tax=Elephas maximus indicus TaxID=99487 RepID=UPI002115D707|nr:P-selectin glycoprotein ligand 1 isoform X2 [Elephas maximus indicus]